MLALLLVSALTAPQDTAPACSFDTAGRLRTDSVVVALAVGARLGNTSASRDEYADAAEVIHEYFQPPAEFVLPIWARTYWTGNNRSTNTDDPSHGLDGDVRFQLDSSGRVLPASIEVETLAVALAASVGVAILRADSARAFARPSQHLLREQGMIRLHFSTPRSRDPHVALMRAIIPSVRLDRVPQIESFPQPLYPAGLLNANRGEKVVLQFVVDAHGHVDSTTISVVQGYYPEFVHESARLVQAARFRPGKIAKCLVPVLVRMPL